MPKKAEELNALAVKRLTRPGSHAVGNPAGLHLYVKPTGARSWVLRYHLDGMRRHLGLGGYPDVPLADARQAAREARALVRQGVDPIEHAQAQRDARQAARAKRLTFADAADRLLRQKVKEFRNPKHAAQWRSTLETYAHPVIGDLPVDKIELVHIVELLNPIWTSKTETATRVRGRVESVLNWATVSGYRSGQNPAAWKGNLDAILPKPTKLKAVEHFAAVPIDDAPGMFAQIRKRKGVAAKAVEFLMLTAARSGEVRGAEWSEIDLQARTWTVPASRMKAEQEHTVPLCDAALALLDDLPARRGLVFPSPRGKVLSSTALTKVLRVCGRDETIHGLRSTFRDWASERTNYAHEVCEQALAHTIPSATEKAYRRGSLLAKRARLMADWHRFLFSSPAAGEVVKLERFA
ncbi:tyrosine-type recombinase/integrase [Wenzhouxiangella limi]|uniref:Integrase arm-type DNA-binding domain-containing protein n=1 Tax=Wenzhouxiangella limi TaxID=2707351 RepID=A0A845VAR1_9GAMM|nr:site-specific integrase [Wenzhouxiangella limi]NDY96985.1 integrase arm-type DNA-binding domain-containing protein [Wenzhouxiangella limi]